LSVLKLTPEEGLPMFEGDDLPAGDELGLAGGFGLASQAGEDLEDDLGLELRG
jgi:hypothetical protein